MRNLFLVLILTSGVWGLSTALVHAQDTEDATETRTPTEVVLRLEEVTVTATKTKRDTLTTPGEVSVLTQEYFQQRQAQSLDDVLRYEPGVDSSGGPRTMGEGPNIRGMSGDRVLTLLDGVRLNFQSGHTGRLFIDMEQLKRVEVIRGPGSALYGSQALGGVVAMETRNPSDFLAPDMQYGIRQKFGYQYANEELLSTTTLSGRLTDQVEVMTMGTFRAGENIRLGGDLGRLSNSAQDTAANLSKIVWRPTPHDEAEFSFQGTRQAAQIPFQTNTTPTSQSSVADRVNRQVTYRLGYTHNNPANPYLNLQGFVYLTTMDITQSRITDRSQRDDIHFDTFGYDLRNSMDFGDPSTHHHIVTFGSEFYRNSQKGEGSRTTIARFVPIIFPITRDRTGRRLPMDQWQRGIVSSTDDQGNLVPSLRPAFDAGGSRVFFPTADANVFSLYAQDEITIMDRVTLIPALRWDHWKNETSGRETKSVGTVNPKIGTVIQVTDSLFLTANYAHGFRQPTFAQLFIAGTHFPGTIFVPNPNLNPERSRNLDAGFRVNLPKVLSGNDQFIFKGTYFRNQVRDFIDLVTIQSSQRYHFSPAQFTRRGPSCRGDQTLVTPYTDRGPVITRRGPALYCYAPGRDTLQTNRNVQKALIQGVEAEFEWRVHENVTLSGNYSYSHGTDETTQQPLSNITPRRGVLGIDYQYPPWGLTLGGRSVMRGDMERVPINGGPPTGGYVLFDVWATVKPGRALLPDLPKSWVQGFQVNLVIDNLTDRNYRRHLSGLPEAGINPKVSFWYSLNLP